MARDKQLAVKTEPTPNSFIASAVGMGRIGKSMLDISRRSSGWQREAWDFYHTVGEFRYACDWVGSMLSKAILHATEEKDGKRTILTTGPVAKILDELGGDTDGRAEMLRQIGIHFSVAGECYILAYTDPVYGEDVWEVVAPTELNRAFEDGPYIINGVTLEGVDPEDVLEIRLWRPDPQRPREAISPARTLLTILAEIVKLTQHVAAQVDSRLASAGIIWAPSEMTMPTPKIVDGKPVIAASVADALLKKLQEIASVAIEDRADASALVPFVVTAPGDQIAQIQHMKFWSDLDAHAIELRNEAIRRLALGMDMPPEVLQGLSDSNHWSAWQADESAIKAHTEPLLKIITTGLARQFLRPAYAESQGLNLPEVRHISILADTAEMRLRPNRSKEALELYDRGELDGTALRRETGFDEEDAMDETERKMWFIRKVAAGQTTPDLVAAALKEIGWEPDLTFERQNEEGQEARPTPSLVEHPEVGPPEREVSERRKRSRERGDVPSSQLPHASYTVAIEQTVFRALERAGNRMRNKIGGKTAGVSARATYLTFAAQPGDLDYYLDDAWGDNIKTLASHMGVPEDKLLSAVDGYVRSLLMSQREHSFEALTRHLDLALTREAVPA